MGLQPPQRRRVQPFTKTCMSRLERERTQAARLSFCASSVQSPPARKPTFCTHHAACCLPAFPRLRQELSADRVKRRTCVPLPIRWTVLIILKRFPFVSFFILCPCVQELGADRVIDYRSESVKAVLKREYPRGVDVVWESVGGDMFSVALDALAPRGRLVIIGMM